MSELPTERKTPNRMVVEAEANLHVMLAKHEHELSKALAKLLVAEMMKKAEENHLQQPDVAVETLCAVADLLWTNYATREWILERLERQLSPM